jgi:hypothetical protein
MNRHNLVEVECCSCGETVSVPAFCSEESRCNAKCRSCKRDDGDFEEDDDGDFEEDDD